MRDRTQSGFDSGENPIPDADIIIPRFESKVKCFLLQNPMPVYIPYLKGFCLGVSSRGFDGKSAKVVGRRRSVVDMLLL